MIHEVIIQYFCRPQKASNLIGREVILEKSAEAQIDPNNTVGFCKTAYKSEKKIIQYGRKYSNPYASFKNSPTFLRDPGPLSTGNSERLGGSHNGEKPS